MFRFLFLFFIAVLSACSAPTKSAPASKSPEAEPHRPAYHFTPPAHWMNDPNGLVYYDGEYHLFYQYYPDSTVWGPMHWGHAVSPDLVHWEHLPIALYPDSLGLIFSGSAVVDWKNTSGFGGADGKPPLVAIFTQHLMAGEKAGRSDFQYQSIAYSNDRGRSWTKYPGNPVIPNTEKIRDFRDPKVVWDEQTGQWIMVFAAQDHVKLWRSPNLKDWTQLSDFGREWGGHGGVWECPDLFPIKVEGSGEQKWVLLQSINPGSPNGGSGTQYFVGDFDGKNFTLDPGFAADVAKPKAVWLDWGRDNYAGVTWSDIPASDGRRLFIGWMSNWDYAMVVPTDNWRSAMTIPRQLTLHRTPAGFRLFSKPVGELKTLRGTSCSPEARMLSGSSDLTQKLGFSPAVMEADLELEFPEDAETDFCIELSNAAGESYRVGFDAGRNMFYSDRTKAGDHRFSPAFAPQPHTAPRSATGRTVRLHLYFDVASCELFADDGETVLTDIFFPSADFTQLRLIAQNGAVQLKEGHFYKLEKAAGK